MKPALIDTDILSFFFRGHPQVVARLNAYTKPYAKINLSIITYYEILSGLKHRDAQQQLGHFLDFVAENIVVPLTEQSVAISADMYAVTRAHGMPIDDIDLLIAGVAMEHGWRLVTHNLGHFERIARLDIEDWAEV